MNSVLPRAKLISSNKLILLLSDEIKYLIQSALQNSYPKHFHDSTLKKFKNTDSQQTATDKNEKYF